MADIQLQLLQTLEAQQSYQKAIATFDLVLSPFPDDIYALNNKGLILAKFSDLQLQLLQPLEAQQSYQKAIATFDHVLSLSPKDI